MYYPIIEKTVSIWISDSKINRQVVKNVHLCFESAPPGIIIDELERRAYFETSTKAIKTCALSK